MAIDYEKEYDNRGRVPEHPEILARYEKAAPAYRAAATAAGRAELNAGYGPSPRQIVDIFYSSAGKDAPLAAFIHGGYWRAQSPAGFSHVAAGLNGRGFTVGLIGYDLAPAVKIGDIIDQVRQGCLYLWRRFQRPILITGHSAGGHLTACMVATDWAALGGPADMVRAGCAISGVYDLEPIRHTSMNKDFGMDEAEARRVSPLYWPVPRGRALDAVVGGDESSEFLRQARTVAEEWRKGGTAARWEAIPGKNHFDVIEALADPKSAMVERLVKLAT